MSNFKQTYKNIMNPMPMMPMFGLREIVSYGGYRYEVMGFEPNEKEGCWVYDLKRVDGTDEVAEGIHELGITKSFKLVEKPGASIHSPKFDSCVEQVEANSKNVNAYAVCTAMLGDASFKSMDETTFEQKMQMYMEKLGIAGAGPVPNSLLARQDLAGAEKAEGYETTEKSTDKANFAVWYYDAGGARKCAVFGNVIDAEAYAKLVEAMGYQRVSIIKGQLENTEKELIEAANEAEYAEGEEVKALVNRIKNTQIRRQKATIRARANETDKSFKQQWGEISRSS